MSSKIAAIIVAYHPDNKKLFKLVSALNAQGCDKIVIYRNSGLEDSLISDCFFCDFIGSGQNMGLGTAINASFEYLKNIFGADFSAFTFDQDTEVADAFVKSMCDMQLKLEASGLRFAAICPRVFDIRSEGYEYELPSAGAFEGFNSLRLALQSGLLIDSHTWLNNKFNEDLFIEYVDTEWCFRLGNSGRYIYRSDDSRIYHELSDELPKAFLGMKLLKYSPLRRYYFYRNSFYMLRSGDVPVYFKFRILTAFINRFISIFAFKEPRIASMKMGLIGIFDGIRSKFGKYAG